MQQLGVSLSKIPATNSSLVSTYQRKTVADSIFFIYSVPICDERRFAAAIEKLRDVWLTEMDGWLSWRMGGQVGEWVAKLEMGD